VARGVLAVAVHVLWLRLAWSGASTTAFAAKAEDGENAHEQSRDEAAVSPADS